MNGYKTMADSYRKLLENSNNYPDLDKEATEKRIKVYDFLATCDKEMKLELFNSTAFNDVVKGYVSMAVDNLELGDDTKKDFLREIKYLFDTVKAGEAEDYYNEH